MEPSLYPAGWGLRSQIRADSLDGIYQLVKKAKQEAQLMLTNPRDAFRDQSRSPNVPFHTLGYRIAYYYYYIRLLRQNDKPRRPNTHEK